MYEDRTGYFSRSSLNSSSTFWLTSKVYSSCYKAPCPWRELPGLPPLWFTPCSRLLWSCGPTMPGVHSGRGKAQEENSFLLFRGSAHWPRTRQVTRPHWTAKNPGNMVAPKEELVSIAISAFKGLIIATSNLHTLPTYNYLSHIHI